MMGIVSFYNLGAEPSEHQTQIPRLVSLSAQPKPTGAMNVKPVGNRQFRTRCATSACPSPRVRARTELRLCREGVNPTPRPLGIVLNGERTIIPAPDLFTLSLKLLFQVALFRFTPVAHLIES